MASVTHMFHSTAFTPDYRGTRDALVRLFGMRVLEFTRSEDPAIGRMGGMTWIGDNSLELGEPLAPGTKQWAWLEKFGGGNHSVAVQVDDVVGTVDRLRALGIGITRVATGNPHQILFTDPRAFGGILVEWFQGRTKVDPRWGAELPQEHMTPLVDVSHQAWVGAVVQDPLPVAERLASALGTAITFEDPGAEPGRPVVGVGLGDCTLALYPLPSDEDESGRLWGRVHTHPRCSLLTLLAVDLRAATAALQGAGVGITRIEPGLVVLTPGPATGHVELALTDALLPHDPRLAGR